jgi:transposase InsO family protein
VKARCLIDCGATHNFIAEHLLPPDAELQPVQKTVRVANGTTVTTKGKVKLSLWIRNSTFHITAWVFHTTQFDLVLGQPWLTQYNPVINWKFRTVEYQQKLLTAPSQSLKVDGTTSLSLASIRDIRQAVAHQEGNLFMVKVSKPKPDDTRSDEQTQKWQAEYPEVFSPPKGLPPQRHIQHSIPTGDTDPVACRPYRLSQPEQKELERHLRELLEAGYIQPSSSAWAAPILFVRKKSGELRMVIDYRRLNKLTTRSQFPIPNVSDIIDQLHGKTHFTVLDLKSGYHQVRVKEEDRHKTAFVTPQGLFEFTVMPFGLTGAPSTFCQLMNSILQPYLRKFVAVYMDDILIYSDNQQDHERHIRLVLDTLKRESLSVNSKKCQFNQPEVEFVGLIVSHDGLKVSPTKTAVANWPTPYDRATVFSFLQFVNWLRSFLFGIADLTTPLSDLLKKDTPFVWGEKQQLAFDQIKQMVCNPPVLKYPDFSKPFVLWTDASDHAVGGILMQGAGPIAFESRKLKDSEKNYSTTDKECLAFVYCIGKFRCYLEGTPFVVKCDHKALQYLMSKRDLTRRQARWLEKLSDFKFSIEHVPGKDNGAADALSRVQHPPPATGDTTAIDGSICMLNQDPGDIWPEYVGAYKAKQLPNDLPKDILMKLEQHANNFEIHEGTLYYKRGEKALRYIPLVERVDTIQRFHESVGHLGVQSTLSLLQERIWFPRLSTFVSQLIQHCPTCQLHQRGRQRTEPLHPLPTAPPFHRWHIDFVGQLPTTRRGNKFLLIAVDHATKWTVMKAVPDRSERTVARFLYEDIFLHYGAPTEIVSDRAKEFMGRVLKRYERFLQVRHKFTSPYHPRTNGAVEKLNDTIKTILTKKVRGAIYRWDDFVDETLFAVRTRVHHATGSSPFQLLYGTSPRLPGDDTWPKYWDKTHPWDNSEQRARQLEALGKLREAAQSRLQQQAHSMTRRYARTLGPRIELRIGDFVLRRNHRYRYFDCKWLGPYLITALGPMGTYRLTTPRGETLDALTHHDNLRLCRVNNLSEARRTWTTSRVDVDRYDQTKQHIPLGSQLSSGGECRKNTCENQNRDRMNVRELCNNPEGDNTSTEYQGRKTTGIQQRT